MEALYKSQSQGEFIKNAFDYYRMRSYNKLARKIYHNEGDIFWLYKLGRDYNLLNVRYEEFKEILYNTHSNYFSGKYYKNRKRYGGRYSHFCEPEYYRVLRSFHYTGQIKKDNPSENAWRRHKGLDRDRRRRNYGKSWKNNLKESCRRKHRQFERQVIRAERYHKFHDKTYKYAENSWNWD